MKKLALTCENTKYTSEQKREYSDYMRRRAYDRASIARRIIIDEYHKAYPHSYRRQPKDGLVYCQNPIDHGDIHLWLDEHGREYHNHKNCKSWACPICAPRRAYARANEIEQALLSVHEKGYKALFLTFTVPHRKSHSSAYVIDLLNKCYRKLLQSHPIRNLKNKYGFIGQIKCLDYTMTDNGTHAHLHTIWLFDAPDIPDHGFGSDWDLAIELNADIQKRWDRMVYIETGKNINRHNGFNLEPIIMDDDEHAPAVVAKYAAKAISVYCSDGDKSKEGSIMPFDLLKDDATEAEKARYFDFYKGQKGRRHIYFTAGLKELLGVSESEYIPPAAAQVAHISYEHAYFLKDEEARQEFERRAACSVSDALDWLHSSARRQQSAFRSRFFDPRVHAQPLDFEMTREEFVINQLDDNPEDYEARIRFNYTRQGEFMHYIQDRHHYNVQFDVPPLEVLSRPRNIDDIYDKYKRGRYSNPPISGLGRFLSRVDKMEKREQTFVLPLAAPAAEHDSCSPFGEDLFTPYAPEPVPPAPKREHLPILPCDEPAPLSCPFSGGGEADAPTASHPSAISPVDFDDEDPDFWF